ncbi:MAG: hypothetical protein HY537_05695 [Deltaproteobacteria bacterium]|nr:hypothetical protein [Deltaproteobacteria bacterium]
MSVRLLLILLAFSGIGLMVVPEKVFGLGTPTESPLSLLLASNKSYAIPLALLLVSFLHRIFAVVGSVLWGSWVVCISLLAMAKLEEAAPNVTFYGKIFVATLAILSLGLVVLGLKALRAQKTAKMTPTVNQNDKAA